MADQVIGPLPQAGGVATVKHSDGSQTQGTYNGRGAGVTILSPTGPPKTVYPKED
jgi:hypothetical protein